MKRLNRRQIRKLVTHMVNEQRYAVSPSAVTLSDYNLIYDVPTKIATIMEGLDSFHGPSVVQMHIQLIKQNAVNHYKQRVAYQTDGMPTVLIMPMQEGEGFSKSDADRIREEANIALSAKFPNIVCAVVEIQDVTESAPMGGYIVSCENAG